MFQMLFIRWLSYIVEIKRKNVIYNTNLIFLFFTFRLFSLKIFLEKHPKKNKEIFQNDWTEKSQKFIFSLFSEFSFRTPEEMERRCHHFISRRKSKRWKNQLQNEDNGLSVKLSNDRISKAEPSEESEWSKWCQFNK